MTHPTKTRIKKMIVERLFLPTDANQIADDADLMETFGIDSVALFELVVGLEDEFGVSMEDVEFSPATFQTVNSIAHFLATKGI